MSARTRKVFEKPSASEDAPTYNACRAYQCPCRASIFDSVVGPPINGLCRYHHRAPTSDWPRLTEVLRSGPLTIGFMRSALIAAGFPWIPLRAEESTIGIEPADGPKGWAICLRKREEAGEHLLPVQRSAWREALGVRHTDAEIKQQAERAAIAAEAA